MCGIIGVLSNRKIDLSPSLLLESIKHRGPDRNNYYYKDNVFLGHTRLSILDLSENGAQPMYSADGELVIIYNGEIYNHGEIRADLERCGIIFKSDCDTETLLYGYKLYGESILNKLNGIFSFAIFDQTKKEIFLARDQFGIKPLYYYYNDGIFIFGSEIKSFLLVPGFNKEIDAFGLLNYVNYLWSPGSTTSFKEVKRLLPGHYLKFNVHEIIIDPIKYYEIPFNGDYFNNSEEEIVDQLEAKLLEAVNRQLLSDVPVGFFLSGGLDSSLIVAMARKLLPNKKIQAFTIDDTGFNKQDGFSNDLMYAKLVAKNLKIELEVVKAEINILRDFDKMVWHLGEPQADAAPLNILNISKRAKEMGFKVLIGGTAADDLFSGYRRHKALYYEKLFSIMPPLLKKFIRSSLYVLPSNIPTFRRLKKVFQYTEDSAIRRRANYFSWLPFPIAKSLFSDNFKKLLGEYDPLEYLEKLLFNIPKERNILNQMLYWELRTFLVDHNLNYTDKMSMAVGVEVRVPYLDVDLVEYSTKIPAELKMKGNVTKYILRKVAKRYLPNSIIYRTKTGFGAPVRKWIIEDLEGKINSDLSNETLNKRRIFDPDAVWKLIRDNKEGRIDASYTIWGLLVLESWFRQFIDCKYDKSEVKVIEEIYNS